METINRITKIMNSVTVKLFVIIVCSLLLLIPTVFIYHLIDERQQRRNEAIYEVTSKWGQEQTLFAPVILVPYEKYEKTSSNTFITRKNYMHILPDELEISGNIKPEMRHRGIYKVVLYSTQLDVKASFTNASFGDWPEIPDNILWSEAVVVAGVSDLTGLDDIKQIKWNNDTVQAEAGIPYSSDIKSGIHLPVKINIGKENTFQMQFMLNGSQSLFFVPGAKTTHVKLTSNWPTPSFDGSTLPDHREITSEGFTANWNVLHLTRPFPQKWSNNEYSNQIDESAFGVNLFIPVDVYQKTTRSVKYALLFIALTFLVIFFTEVMSKKRIHTIQYLLIGAALVIFYSLLLAISEHLPFGWSYLIAASATIGLIVSFVYSLFGKKSSALLTFGVLTVLYGFLFAILHLSDMALLLGNIGLFIILGIVMFFSRKIDWYADRNPETDQSV